MELTKQQEDDLNQSISEAQNLLTVLRASKDLPELQFMTTLVKLFDVTNSLSKQFPKARLVVVLERLRQKGPAKEAGDVL